MRQTLCIYRFIAYTWRVSLRRMMKIHIRLWYMSVIRALSTIMANNDTRGSSH